MSESIYLVNPDGAIYEARSSDQAKAMATLGWGLATKAQVDDDIAAKVAEQADAYEKSMAASGDVVVFADDNPIDLDLEAPAPAAELPDPPQFSTPPSGTHGADDTDPEA